MFGDLLSQIKVGEAGSFRVGRLPGVLGLHNLLLDGQAELASVLEQNKALGESFSPATLPASLITLALDLGTLNDKLTDLKFI